MMGSLSGSNAFILSNCIVVLLLCSKTIAMVVSEDLLRRISREDKPRHSILFEAGEEDVAIPYEVDEKGQFLSDNVGWSGSRSQKGVGDAEFQSRPRRGVEDVEFQSRSGVEEAEFLKSKCFKFSAFKEEFHLCVYRNVELVSSNFVVEAIRRGRKITTDHPRPDCYWTGFLESHANSSVAISTCDGMAGLLRTSDSELMIEPLANELKGNKANASKRIPHLIKRRPLRSSGSPTDALGQSFCSTERRKEQNHHRSRNTRNSDIMADPIPNPYIEVMVVVDYKTYQAFNRNKTTLEQYVLLMMNIVSLLYSDGPHGVGITITVVQLRILSDDKSGLNVSNPIEAAHRNFCQWQQQWHVADDHPMHYDLAILLTGVDLCLNNGHTCIPGVIGKASLGKVCDPDNSCAIAEALGFVTPFVIAHEIGHTLSLEHDGVPHDPFAKHCSSKDGYVMADLIPKGSNTFLWSTCSKAKLQQFLRRPEARCLADKPSNIIKVTFLGFEPGARHSAKQQCQFTYPGAIRECTRDTHKYEIESILQLPSNWTLCNSLVCDVMEGKRTRCKDIGVSAADFTPCDNNKVCLRGHCVVKQNPRHGQWSQYYPLEGCSRSCGGGVVTERRYCNNPMPRFNGRDCSGAYIRRRLCNTQPCPIPTPGIPEPNDCESLTGFSGGKKCIQMNGGKHQSDSHWFPYLNKTPGEECTLHCKMVETGCTYSTGLLVEDGTPCSDDGEHRCVNNACKKFGCDRIVDSSLVVDNCNICGGDNSTCKRVTKTFTKELQKKGNYLVKKFDVGNFGIVIQEMSASEATSLILLDSNGRYMLDFRTALYWPEMDYNGTLIVYKRVAGQPEVITIKDPLKTPLQLRVHYSPEHGPNPGIRFTFTRNRSVDLYHWSFAGWSACSVTCGRGIVRPVFQCYRKQRLARQDILCDGKLKPDIAPKACTRPVCPQTNWSSSEWSLCSSNCENQSRKVACYMYVGDKQKMEVADSLCLGSKPASQRKCAISECACMDKLALCLYIKASVTFPTMCATNENNMGRVCCVSCQSTLSSRRRRQIIRRRRQMTKS